MEQMVNAAAQQHHLPATILRFGTFYSHDSAQTQNMLSLTSKGWFPVIGDGRAYWNMINVDDAANAVVKTVENYPQAVSHTFNVCDDEPVTYGDLIAHLAQTLGARKPMRLHVFLANMLLGSGTVRFLLASARCHNQLAKEKLGWRPQYPTHREGFAAEIKKWQSL
jgi:nucleoside-diphosphate-sugar epimerase